MVKEVTWYDDHDKMKYSHGDERYDQYGSGSDHNNDDYDQKNMMMKNKKY